MGTTFTFARQDGETTVLGIGCSCRDDALCIVAGCEDWADYQLCEHTEDKVWCAHRAVEADFSLSNAESALAAMGFEPTAPGDGAFGVVDAYEFTIRARRAAAASALAGDRDMQVHLVRLARLGTAAWRQQAQVGWS